MHKNSKKRKKEERTSLSEVLKIYSTNVILAYPLPLCPVSVPPPGAGKDLSPATVWALDKKYSEPKR